MELDTDSEGEDVHVRRGGHWVEERSIMSGRVYAKGKGKGKRHWSERPQED